MKNAGQAEAIWFLAEMAVSEQHGGGVTLCRTLGRNMDEFDGLFCLSDFHEIAPHLRERSIKWMPFFRSDFSRRILGCRLSEWCFRQVWAEKWHARQCAKRIHGLLPVSGPRPLFLTSPQTTLAIRTMEQLQKLRTLSYVTWIMDDNWVAKNPRNGEWNYPRNVAPLLDRHLRQAAKVVTISQQMGEHYQKFFGIDFEVLFAPSPNDGICAPTDFTPSRKLAYFGTLSIWPGDALARLVPLLPELGYTLDIFSHHSLPSNLQHSHVCKMQPLPSAEVQSKMREYDAVLLPIGFSSATASYTNFNIATKMAECLGSGTVTLAIGPEHAAMIRYFKTHDLGLCVSDVNLSTVKQAFNVINSRELRSQSIENDLAHVRSRLTQVQARRRWESIRDSVLFPVSS